MIPVTYAGISQHENLAVKLTSAGFENVRIKTSDRFLLISYENRMYRFEPDAILEIIKIITPEILGADKIMLIPLNRNIPLLVIEADLKDCRDYTDNKIGGSIFSEKLSINFNTDEYFEKLKDTEPLNTSTFRFDLAFKPQLKFEFGPYEKPVLTQINLSSNLSATLWKGMNFNYELILPVINQFGAREDSVRPGIISANQVFRLPEDLFFSFSAGVFTQNRYGFDIEARKYFLNGDLNLNFNAGVTSIVSFSGLRKIYYYDAFIWTGSIGGEYRIEKYDLTVGISAGKYLMGDESIRFDINREFNEIEIGFFAIHSRNGISNGGVNLTIPLFPAHYWKPDVIRIRNDENFDWSYLVKTNSDQMIGLRYNTGNRLGVFYKRLNPSFVRNYFLKN